MAVIQQLWPALLSLSLALALPTAARATPSPDPNSAKACAALSTALPHLVALPNTPAYAQHSTYWSARQTEVHPACFVAPSTTQEVSRAIALLTSLDAPFTVKAGGHTAFAGGSNIAGGVTVDLAGLDGIAVAADRRSVAVGAGSRWINVSEALDPLGLAVVGGRSATVGVSGLTLGGGISYFSGRYGWACDNVRTYEVVLASGEVGDLWASSVVYPGVANATVIALMHGLLVEGLAAHPAAHTYFVMTYVAALGGYVVLSDQFHSTHADGTATPEVFAAFHDAALPTLSVNTRLSNTSQLLRDIEEPFGDRQTSWDTTVAATATPELLLDIVPLFEKHVARLLAAAAAANSTVTPYLVYQAISTNIIQAMQVNGGNALGLRPEDGPIMIVQVTTTWSSAALDDMIENSSRELIAEVDALAASRNATSKNGYIYMNYAGKTQDVYAGYGKENLARLRSVAKQYDPTGKFRNLWNGYFKLW
ncbi:67badf07-eebf-4e54-b365-4163a452ea67 [Thermothielavioides terrestris]|uniref:67badf07-eebf-4e54-b365-4163a452ea67 n=1 Tax=Thermothielavioides terrestris TaxID=2587410 RepID=A0A3S4BJ26_9PEZI|nr:67badf07-eebf-4e54-b365-4163a452ea67 [Thermothielavioides terrestris]